MADFNEPTPDGTLPHRGDKGAYKSTIANIKALLNHYGISCNYNEINKQQCVTLSQSTHNTHDLADNSNYALLRSLLSLNNMPVSATDLIPFLMAENTTNPITGYLKLNAKQRIDSNDRVDYFQWLADSLIVADTDKAYRDLALKTWMYQCVAAADYAINSQAKGAAKFELVLVLQGGQGIGKSTWLKNLLPDHLKEYFAENEHLDPNDVNSLRRCLSSWICEIGELDATFRKADMERLKAFLSQSVDKIRLPYDRAISNYKRRTSFAASVNVHEFLVDKTGNRRFLPIALLGINRVITDEIMGKVWGQIYHEYSTMFSATWWANSELERMLVERHDNHAETSSVEEKLADTFNLTQLDDTFAKHYTVTRALEACGVSNPSKQQIKEAKQFIEKKGFKQVQTTKGARGYMLNRNAIEE